MSLIPFVIEKTGQGERSFDIFSRLLNERIVFINGAIHTEMSHVIVGQILHLESVDSEKDIHIYVNSPGGEVTAGLAILDVMNFVKPDICTYVLGQAASMGSLLASSGTKGKRFMLPHSRHLIHQPLGGANGQASDMEIQVTEILRMKKELTEIYVKNTGQTFAKLTKDMDRDNIMNAKTSVQYGLADQIVTKR